MSASTPRSPARPAALALALALAATPAAVVGAVPASAASFVDTAGSVHAESIERLVELGITRGCDADGLRYCPDRPVTRGQMATFLVRALALPPGTSDVFVDDDGTTHEASIDRLAEEGITLGSSDGAFEPGRVVTRDQMASFLTRAFRLPASQEAPFTDVSGTHAASISALVAAGVTSGCDATGTRYCPTDPVSRAQMASFLMRALDAAGSARPDSGSSDGRLPEGSASGVSQADDGVDVASDEEVAVTPESSGELAAWSDEDLAASAETEPLQDPSTGTAAPADQLYAAATQQLLAGTSGWATQTVPQVGRLWAVKPNGRTSFCSGTVVRRGLVLTAAHCVVNADGDYTDFLFIPAKAGAAEPYGRWSGSRAYYFSAYREGGAWSALLDYALVHIPQTASGAWIGDVVGTFPVVLNSHRLGLRRVALGYPGVGWYATWGGNHLWYCDSTDVRWTDYGGGWATKSSGCNANGGFSGGPIFEYWNGAWHIGAVNEAMTYPPPGGTAATHWLSDLRGPSLNEYYDALLAAVR
jgi:V8-like Glu-specific endopeptidase